MNQLIGINTGIIKSPQGVVALALKFVTSSGGRQVVYLPPEQLQSMLLATFSGYRTLRQLHQQMPEPVREFVITQTQALSGQIPVFAPEEMNSPNIEHCVSDFVMKQRHNNIHVLFFMQNGEVLPLEITYVQTEYVLNLLLSTIQNADDESFTAYCLSTNDFLPLYTIDFSEGEGINYNQFSSPEWKKNVFDTFHSIVYIQPEGIISCGAIVKAAPTFEPGRIESIAAYLLQKNSMLSAYKDRSMTISHMRLDIPSAEGTLDALLRAHLSHRKAKAN